MKLLTINEISKAAGDIGQVVGFFPDAHIFSERETEIFSVTSFPISQGELDELARGAESRGNYIEKYSLVNNAIKVTEAKIPTDSIDG